MFTTIIFDPTTGFGVGRGLYSHEPELAANEVACTPAQYAGFGQFKLVKGAIVAATAADLAPSKAQLVAYANTKQVALRDGGITVNVGTAAAPTVIDVATDVNGRDLVAGNVQYAGLCAQAGQPAPTFNWLNDPVNGAPGSQTVLTAAQMMSVGLTVRAFVQATFDALGVIGTAIANGTVTSTSQVDASAWPTTSF